MQKREIVIYKPHGTKISILSKGFDPRFHERLGEKTILTQAQKESLPDQKDEISQEEIEALWEEYRKAYGRLPVGRWKSDIKWIKEKIAEAKANEQ